MRAIIIATLALLVMTGTALADPALSVVWNPDPGTGLRSYTLVASGEEINELGEFTISGPVYQVYQEHLSQVWQTAWVNDATLVSEGPPPVFQRTNDPLNPKDSYVIFGSVRIPDLAGILPPPKTFVTTETKAGTTLEGVGTLNNSVVVGGVHTYDAYIATSGTYPPGTTSFDLMQLVIPDGQTVDVTVSLTKYLGGSSAQKFAPVSLSIYSPWDGDANLDGKVDGIDVAKVALNWQKSNMTWQDGDFSGDGVVNGVDVSMLALNWQKGVTGGAAAIPEPSTVVMLVLGALCLVGYRMRKK